MLLSRNTIYPLPCSDLETCPYIKQLARIIVPAYTLHEMECCGQAEIVYAFLMDREESKERKNKRITMAQWVNRLWNNSFVNATRLPLLC